MTSESSSVASAPGPAVADSAPAAAENCPECSAPVEVDGTEAVCSNCGLVVDESTIDHGQEWRAFNATEVGQRQRTGPPPTNRRHDRGLQTTIDWRNRDGYGKTLSSSQRHLINRLRRQQRRTEQKNSVETNLAFGLSEIDRMASSLGFSDQVIESAALLFRQAHEAGLARGRSLEGVASACVYAAGRLHDVPRPLDTVTAASRLTSRTRIFRTYQTVASTFSLGLSPILPRQLVPQFVAELTLVDREAPQAVEQQALAILEELEESDLNMAGYSPSGVAATTIYLAGVECELFIAQEAVAAAAQCSPATITGHHLEFRAAAPSLAIDAETTTAYQPPADRWESILCPCCTREVASELERDLHHDD